MTDLYPKPQPRAVDYDAAEEILPRNYQLSQAATPERGQACAWTNHDQRRAGVGGQPEVRVLEHVHWDRIAYLWMSGASMSAMLHAASHLVDD